MGVTELFDGGWNNYSFVLGSEIADGYSDPSSDNKCCKESEMVSRYKLAVPQLRLFVVGPAISALNMAHSSHFTFRQICIERR
jgi:hypothetical protein